VIKRALALIGAAVVALWILGALGLGDFRLCFAAVGKCERPNVAGNRLAEGKSGLTGLLGGPTRSEKE